MILSDLKIHQLRTISSAHLLLNSRFNFIVGPNGSGKTSILEALYLLSCGHSFRSREIAPIISFDKDTLTVFSRSVDGLTISIQKSNTSPTQIKLNNQYCSSTSQLAYALPCQIVYADIFQIIDAGASERRAVLDWGLFHVKHNYLSVWKEYKRALKQRNALLKQQASYEQFVPWDEQLALFAEQLHLMRQEYFQLWNSTFQEVMMQITEAQCTLSYYKGWDKRDVGKTLQEVLAEQFPSDKQRQYTQYGAHHADIHIESMDVRAKHTLSRGQQKIVLIALKLAQGKLINKNCLYLFDDLSAELDEAHQSQLLLYLNQNQGQYIITSTQAINIHPSIKDSDKHYFATHLGTVTKCFT
jgi:DNA replication and repair protein RecF